MFRNHSNTMGMLSSRLFGLVCVCLVLSPVPVEKAVERGWSWLVAGGHDLTKGSERGKAASILSWEKERGLFGVRTFF